MRKKIFIIIAIATFLRLFLLARVPPSLNWDEVSMGYSAYSIMQTGMDEWGSKLPLFFRSYGEWKSAGYIYLLVPFIKILGLNVWAIRLPSALFGILGVYLTYLIGKMIYSEKVGLWASLFMAVSPWALMLSRPGFEANVSLTLILAGVYFFIKSLSPSFSGTRYTVSGTRYLIYSAILLGLAPHTYNSAKIFVPLLVVWLIWRSRIYKDIKQTALYLGILALFAAPILLNLFSGVSQARLNQVSVITDGESLAKFYSLRAGIPGILGKIIVNKATYTLYKVGDNMLSYFSPAFLLTRGGDHTQHSLPFHGVLYLTEFILLLVGLTQLHNSKFKITNSEFKYLSIILIIIGFLPAAATRDEGHVLRSILTLPGWQLLAGLGIANLQNIKFPYLKFAYWTLAIEVLCFMFMYFSVYPHVYTRDWQYGHKQVAQYLQAHGSEYDSIVMTKWFGEPQLFLAFYNAWDPVQYQRDNVANLAYEQEGRMWLDQLPSYSMGKYTFKYIDWDHEPRDTNTLYIGKFDDFGSGANILDTIYYPDGTVAFVIATATK